jgi:cysteinylglycine-S-conjugate dipeptidase
MNADQPEAGQLTAAARRVLPSVGADLERLVRIPSVSADPAAAPHLQASADEVAALLGQAGLPQVDVLSVAGGQPAVLGRRPGPPGAPPCTTRTATWPCRACPAARQIRST